MRKTVSAALDVSRGLTDGNSLSLLHSWQTSGLQIYWNLYSHRQATLKHANVPQQSEKSRFSMHFALKLNYCSSWKKNCTVLPYKKDYADRDFREVIKNVLFKGFINCNLWLY